MLSGIKFNKKQEDNQDKASKIQDLLNQELNKTSQENTKSILFYLTNYY